MKVLFVSLTIIIVDQLCKLFVKGVHIPSLNIHLQGIRAGQEIPVISDFFNITLVENPGIGFGVDLGADYKLLITLMTLIIFLGMMLYLYMIRFRTFRLRLAIGLIIGGAFGNLIDRMFYGVIYGYAPLMYGKVVDFFNINFFNIYIFNRTFGNYIFNIADLSITAGVILLFFSYGNLGDEETSKKSQNVLV